MNVDQVIEQMSAQAYDHANATLVSNEADGVVGYSYGSMVFQPGSNFDAIKKTLPRAPRLTTGDAPDRGFRLYFSNRLAGFEQPFSNKETMQLGTALDYGPISIILELKFFDWGGGSFRVVMERRGDLLCGLGPSLSASSEALYVMAFSGLVQPTKLDHYFEYRSMCRRLWLSADPCLTPLYVRRIGSHRCATPDRAWTIPAAIYCDGPSCCLAPCDASLSGMSASCLRGNPAALGYW